MTDAPGNNSQRSAGAPFNAAFPSIGIAAGALDSTGTNMVPFNVDANGNLKVVTSGAAGTSAVNLVQVGGSAISLGQKGSATSFPVVLASDQSNVTTVLGAALPAGTNAIGTVSITQALPSGTNALGTVSALQSGNWSAVLLAGTAAIGTVSALQAGTWTAFLGAGSNAIGTVSITQALPAGTNALGTVSITQAIPAGTNALGTVSALQSGNWSVLNLAGTAAIGTVSALQSGAWSVTNLAGTAAIGTVSVTGALPAGTNALGTVSITQAIPAGTNAIGTVSAIQSGTFTAIVSAVATANMTTASASSATTSAVTIIAALATGTAIYVGSIQFSNSGTVASLVTLSDIAGSKFLVAGGAVNNAIFGVPLKTNTHSALTMTLSVVSTSVICNVQGWGGP